LAQILLKRKDKIVEEVTLRASIALPSAPVKNTQGPGLTGSGGLPAFGVHGS